MLSIIISLIAAYVVGALTGQRVWNWIKSKVK